jgi:hypothetical protein
VIGDPDSGRTPVLQTDGDTGGSGGALDTLAEDVARRYAEATVQAGCVAGPIVDPRLSALALENAVSDAQAERFGTNLAVIDRAESLDPTQFAVVGMLYASTAMGVDDVMAGWSNLPDGQAFYDACYQFAGVGVAPAGSGLHYLTLLLAKAE